MPTRAQGARIQQLAAALAAAYGPQHWWPAETRFEVLLGAILTQNTAWTNVEKALDQLRSVVALEPETILSLSREDLAQAIRPAGYFNQKAARIQGFHGSNLAIQNRDRIGQAGGIGPRDELAFGNCKILKRP